MTSTEGRDTAHGSERRDYPKVSVIIPLHNLNERFERDFNSFLNLDYPNYEIIIVHDIGRAFKNEKSIDIPTNKVRTSPAEKRDLAISHANGAICAFIDDDAYPRRDWIKGGVEALKDATIAAVGGPGLTPAEDSFMQKAGGLVYESLLGSGLFYYRFRQGRSRINADDLPAYNLFVRTAMLKEVGGFGSKFYGGEDTRLCLKLLKMGKRMVCDPNVVVYHHRRPLFLAHARQIANVGLHRGYFAKKFPETSFKPIYFLPSIILIFLIGGLAASLIWREFFLWYSKMLLLYVLASFIFSLRCKNIFLSVVTTFGIIVTHLSYGLFFIKGIFREELND